jgi:hypothetical protein
MTAAPKLRTDLRRLASGRVLLSEGQIYSVALDDGDEVIARRAASCLLAPKAQDRVVVACLPEPYILAVLERQGQQAAEIDIDGDVRISAPTGKLELAGAAGLSLITKRSLSLLSDTFKLRSRQGEIVVKQLSAIAGAAQAQAQKLSFIAQSYDGLVDRIVIRAKQVFRFVEQYDQARARHLDYRGEETLQLNGKHTAVTADHVVKIDGEQVHVG